MQVSPLTPKLQAKDLSRVSGVWGLGFSVSVCVRFILLLFYLGGGGGGSWGFGVPKRPTENKWIAMLLAKEPSPVDKKTRNPAGRHPGGP